MIDSEASISSLLATTKVTQRFEEAKAHILANFQLNFLLEVLEDIFSLIFLPWSSEDIHSSLWRKAWAVLKAVRHLHHYRIAMVDSPGVGDGGSFSYSHLDTFVLKQDRSC